MISRWRFGGSSTHDSMCCRHNLDKGCQVRTSSLFIWAPPHERPREFLSLSLPQALLDAKPALTELHGPAASGRPSGWLFKALMFSKCNQPLAARTKLFIRARPRRADWRPHCLVRRLETVRDGTILFRYLLVQEQQVDDLFDFNVGKLFLKDRRYMLR